jgi:hypothetical protein
VYIILWEALMAPVMLTQDYNKFFAFRLPHISDEVPDNYIKHLGWIPNWKPSNETDQSYTKGRWCTHFYTY